MTSIRKLKQGSNAVVFGALAIGIVVLLNLVFSQFALRIDMTKDQLYTISEASKKLVRAIPDRLTIKAFISSDLPPRVQGHARYVREVLDEYAQQARGKLVWEALDPSKSEEARSLANQLKIPPARLTVVDKGKASVSNSYLGLAFQYSGKTEKLPFVTDLSNLEYHISSTIRKLTGDKRKVGFTVGHGEPTLQNGLTAVKNALDQYDVTAVDLTEGKTPIPADVDVLVMVSPRSRLAERAKYEIDNFLMQGKPVAMFLDGVVVDLPRGQFQPHQPKPRVGRANVIGIREQLEYYGVALGEGMVMDEQNQRVILPAGEGQQVVTNHPAFPVATDLCREVPITRHLRELVFAFPSSVEVTKAARASGDMVEILTLARSTKFSWRQDGIFIFSPVNKPTPTEDKGPFDLAVYLRGSFKSFYAGREVPAPGPAKPPSENDDKPAPTGRRSPTTTRLIVVGDGELIQDGFLSLSRTNLLFLQNAVDFLAQDESLIGVRAKTQTRRPLSDVEPSKIAYITWGNVIGVPLLFVLFGIAWAKWHQAARKRRARKIAVA